MKPCTELDHARRSGAKFYSTGISCKHGHVGLRRTKSSKCVECENEENQRTAVRARKLHAALLWNKNNPERCLSNSRHNAARKVAAVKALRNMGITI